MEIFSRFGLVDGMSSVFALVQQLTASMARASRPSRQTSGWLPSATSRSRAHDVRAHDDGAHDDGVGRGVPTDPMTGRATARARFPSRRGGRFAWRGCRGLRAYAAVGLRDPGEGLFDVFAAALPGGLAAGVTGDFCAHGASFRLVGACCQGSSVGRANANGRGLR